MPKVTIWVRVEDYSKWQDLKDKPEFIHNALNPREIAPMRPLTQEDVSALDADMAKQLQQDRENSKPIKTSYQMTRKLTKRSEGEPSMVVKVIKTPKDAERVVDLGRGPVIQEAFEKEFGKPVRIPPNSKLCKIHGTPLDSRDKCLQKGH